MSELIYESNPVCKLRCYFFAGRTGHTEVVRVVFHPEQINFANLLKVFWESHNPTQGTTSPTDALTTRPLKEYREFVFTDEQKENVPERVLCYRENIKYICL